LFKTRPVLVHTLLALTVYAALAYVSYRILDINLYAIYLSFSAENKAT